MGKTKIVRRNGFIDAWATRACRWGKPCPCGKQDLKFEGMSLTYCIGDSIAWQYRCRNCGAVYLSREMGRWGDE